MSSTKIDETESMQEFIIGKFRPKTTYREIEQSLSPRQIEFMKQFVWSFRFEPREFKVLLMIRKTEFSEREITRLFWLFPNAQMR